MNCPMRLLIVFTSHSNRDFALQRLFNLQANVITAAPIKRNNIPVGQALNIILEENMKTTVNKLTICLKNLKRITLTDSIGKAVLD